MLTAVFSFVVFSLLSIGCDCLPIATVDSEITRAFDDGAVCCGPPQLE